MKIWNQLISVDDVYVRRVVGERDLHLPRKFHVEAVKGWGISLFGICEEVN